MTTQSDDAPIEVQTDAQAADMLNHLGSKELRSLASNAGVSRERGDTKRKTAEKLVAQDPALVARIIENDPEVGMRAGKFRHQREVGRGAISLDEAMKRARHKKMHYKLKGLKRALAEVPKYEAEVQWEYAGGVYDGSSSVSNKKGYEPGLTAIQVAPGEDISGMSYLVKGRAHIHLTPYGRCTMFETDSGTYESTHVDRNSAEPSKGWKAGLRSIKNFYEPDDDE